MNLIDLPVLDVENPVVNQPTRLPDGDVILTQPIRVTNREQIHLVGGKRTRIRWRGDPAIGVIQYVGVRRGSIGGDGPNGFEIICERSGTNAGVLIANSPIQGGFVSTGIQVRGVHIRHAGSQVAFEKGFSVDSHIADPTGSGHSFNNNENHRFTYCSVESVLKAAWHVRGHQCYDISLRDCEGLDAGRNGVKNWIYGLWVESGASVILKNTQFNRCEVDVFMGWPCLRCTFEGHNSEHGRCLVSNVIRNPLTGVLMAGATSSDYYVHGRDIRWQGEPRATMPAIDLFGRGPFTFTSSFLSGVNGVCPRIAATNYTPFKGRLDLNGVTIAQHGGTLPTEPIVSTPPTWTPRLWGTEHRHNVSGGVQWRPIVANQSLQEAVDN